MSTIADAQHALEDALTDIHGLAAVLMGLGEAERADAEIFAFLGGALSAYEKKASVALATIARRAGAGLQEGAQ